MNNKVIIVGGGIAGLAMSLFLKKKHIESVVYEQAKAYGKVGGHFVIHPSGVQMLQLLGLGEELKANSHSLVDFVVLDKDNNSVFGEIDEGVEQVLEQEFEEMPMFINITRYHLIDILYKEAIKQGVKVIFSKRLKHFTQDANQVNVLFEDGTEEIGSILIGADGVRSKTREQLFPFPTKPLKYLGKTGVYGIVNTERLGDLKKYFTTETANIYFHENFNFFVSKHLPTAEEVSWSIITTEPRKLPKEAFDEKPVDELRKELAARFEGWETPIKQLIENTEHLIAKSLYRIDLMEHYSCGRVVLIGDALHTADPNAGMGTTLGLEDAMYLAKMLSCYDYEDAFYYYEHDRKPRAKKVYHSANILDNLAVNNVDEFALFDNGIEVSFD